MQKIKSLKFTLFNFLIHQISVCVNLDSNKHHHIGVSKKGTELMHVWLIVENFSFNFLTWDSAELSSASGIPCANYESLADFHASCSYYLVSDFDHSLIDSLWVASHLECTFFVNISKPTKHMLAGNFHLIKHKPSIVLRLISKFGAEVSNFNPANRMMSLLVSNFNKEAVYTVIAFIYEATGKYKCMVRPASKTTRPVFCARDCWRVDHPFISFQIEGRRRFYALNIRSVAQLRLGIAAHNFHGSNVFKPKIVLFLATKFLNGSLEHPVVQGGRINTSIHVLRHCQARFKLLIPLRG